MSTEMVTDMMQEALFLILKTSAPQEQTLTFVPKMVGMFVGLMILGHWMLNEMSGYMEDLWRNFTIYIR